MYDASGYEIELLQQRLEENGISKTQLNLDNLAGLTFGELNAIVKNAIAKEKAKKGEQGNADE